MKECLIDTDIHDNQVVGEFYVDLLVEDEIIARPPRLSKTACQAERGGQGESLK